MASILRAIRRARRYGEGNRLVNSPTPRRFLERRASCKSPWWLGAVISLGEARCVIIERAAARVAANLRAGKWRQFHDRYAKAIRSCVQIGRWGGWPGGKWRAANDLRLFAALRRPSRLSATMPPIGPLHRRLSDNIGRQTAPKPRATTSSQRGNPGFLGTSRHSAPRKNARVPVDISNSADLSATRHQIPGINRLRTRWAYSW